MAIVSSKQEQEQDNITRITCSMLSVPDATFPACLCSLCNGWEHLFRAEQHAMSPD